MTDALQPIDSVTFMERRSSRSSLSGVGRARFYRRAVMTAR